jgi:hypothetical protein
LREKRLFLYPSERPPGNLSSRPTAVDQDGVASDERSRRRGQEHDRSRDIADAVQAGDTLDDVCAKCRYEKRPAPGGI